ncbi:hypothetical protein SDC9_132118 [bioreactor metagenome]|uniref:Uncharacterized protein n=1 Tax=bioreactor metagenome TaxID=1076179 RepID=A0A645D713_9ZZZZ
MLRRPRLHLARHAVQPLVRQRAQRPAGAVAAEHVEVVDVDVAIAVRLADLGCVDVREPVVRRHLACHVQDQPAQRVALVGVGVHTPIGAREVFVDGAFHVHQRLPVGPQRGVALAVGHVGARGLQVVGGDQRLLHHVLNLLDGRRLAAEAVDQHLGGLGRQQLRFLLAELAGGAAGARDGRANAVRVERGAGAIALDHVARQGGQGGGHAADSFR